METRNVVKTGPLLVVISGPAGVGKDAVLRELRKRGIQAHFGVTATDRPRRPNEVHGRDYYFVNTAEFQRMIEAGELLEHALVYDKNYGIPRKPIREALEAGLDVIVRLDVQGAATVRRLAPEAVLIFLAPSSEEELAERLRRRGTDSPDQLALRLGKFREEMERIPEFDYVVLNRDNHLDEAVDRVVAIITAEHCRVRQRTVRL
jgi:guanylate kinase